MNESNNESSYLGKIIEPFIIFVIIIAILQTFFEEYATFSYMGKNIRLISLIVGFAIDVIFSIEFFARLFISAKRRAAIRYFTREGGFIDFISSLPLLLLNSGPLIYITFFAGKAGIISSIGTFSFFKIVKIVRIVRTFRFLRTLKLFNKIKRKYVITSRYISSIAAISIAVVLLSVIGFSFINGGNVIKSSSIAVENVLRSYLEDEKNPDFSKLLKNDNTVLFIKNNKSIVYQKISLTEFNNSFMNDDFYKKKIGSYLIYFNNKDAKSIASYINMLAFSIIIGIIIIISLPYRYMFNKHIVSIIAIMLRGFKKSSYMTPVRIDEKRSELESYQLAEQYNRKWLPLKRKILELREKR